MAVYVDHVRLPFGRMLMSHLMADTPEELLEMVDQIGVARRWIQKEGTRFEHFDICESKRALAIRKGAKAVSARDLVMIRRRKEGGS